MDTIKKVLILYKGTTAIDIESYVDFTLKRQGQDVRYALNDDKLRALGWKPKVNFDTELKYIVEYSKEKFIW